MGPSDGPGRGAVMIDPEFSNAAAGKPQGAWSDWENILKRSLIVHCVALVLTASTPIYHRFGLLTGFLLPGDPAPFLLAHVSAMSFAVGFLALVPTTLVAALMAACSPGQVPLRGGELLAAVATSLALFALQLYAILPLVQ